MEIKFGRSKTQIDHAPAIKLLILGQAPRVKYLSQNAGSMSPHLYELTLNARRV